ncbi:hypothetical protein FGB62_66g014 [Gracilaria domingensis]|nr:hypothetical protein FGB62_66g014 [Gracilaria domingensis]
MWQVIKEGDDRDVLKIGEGSGAKGEGAGMRRGEIGKGKGDKERDTGRNERIAIKRKRKRENEREREGRESGVAVPGELRTHPTAGTNDDVNHKSLKSASQTFTSMSSVNSPPETRKPYIGNPSACNR